MNVTHHEMILLFFLFSINDTHITFAPQIMNPIILLEVPKYNFSVDAKN